MQQKLMTENKDGELIQISKRELAERLIGGVEESLETIHNLLKTEDWSRACFWSLTVASQALESYLICAGKGRNQVESVGKMAQMCAELEPEFSQIVRRGKYLDRYYNTTRYPDALPYGAMPHQWFNEDDAQEAMRYAAEIVAFTRRRIAADNR